MNPKQQAASPSAFAICGLPPERSFTGLASFAPGLAFAPGFAGPLAFVPAFAVFVALAAGLRATLARDARLAFGFAMLVIGGYTDKGPASRPWITTAHSQAIEIATARWTWRS